MPNRRFYGWTLLAALWSVMFLNLGFPAYGPSVINPAMAKAVGLNREALGNMLMVYMIMSGLPGPLVAMSVNRFGVRKTLGASRGTVVRLLVGQFLRPVLIANLLAWPVAYWALEKWLSQFDDGSPTTPGFAPE